MQRLTIGALPVALFVICASRAAPQGTDDGQWTMPGKNYSATRFSTLAQINAQNVGRLHAVWNFSTGVLAGHEGQPLVVNKTMYVVTPYPDVLYAFDLTKPDYPLKWKYRPAVDPGSIGIACCDVINRGASYADGKIVYNLLDGHTVAVDAATGKPVWNTKTSDMSPNRGNVNRNPLSMGLHYYPSFMIRGEGLGNRVTPVLNCTRTNRMRERSERKSKARVAVAATVKPKAWGSGPADVVARTLRIART